MKTKNKPVFIPCHSVCSVVNGRLSVQRDSGNSILGVGVLRILRSLGIMGGKAKNKNSPAQRDSKMSNGRLSGLFCRWQGGQLPETTPAQRDSKMSNGRLSGVSCWPHGQRAISTMQIKNIIRCFMGRLDYGWMWQRKSTPAQQDSGISNLADGAYRSYGAYGTHGPKTCNENRPAQRDSENSNLGVLRILRSLGILGRKVKNKISPAQAGSKNSKLDFPLCLCVCV